MTLRKGFAVRAIVVCTLWVLVFNFLVPFLSGWVSSLLPHSTYIP